MTTEISTDISKQDLPMLEKLYTDSFPAEERRPWKSVVNPESPYGPQLHAIITDGRIAGFLTLWRFERFAYIEHLAIDPAFRSKGSGSSAVRLICELCGMTPVVVEIEPPVESAPDTMRRLAFYRRLGFETIDRDYVQPPYSPGLPSVPLHLMATAVLPPASTARTLHTHVYKASH